MIAEGWFLVFEKHVKKILSMALIHFMQSFYLCLALSLVHLTYPCNRVGALQVVGSKCFAIKKVFFIQQQNTKQSARLHIPQRFARSLFQTLGAVVGKHIVDDDKAL
jgi:hypothetical protein